MTSEVTPHHIALTENEVLSYNTNCKVNPPLRTDKDRKSVIQGLKEGTIDCIATDHAPHLDQEKNREFDLAPFGINGLETAVPVLLKFLVSAKHISLMDLIEKLTVNPAKILRRNDIGRLSEGALADISIIDLELKKVINDDFFCSKSKNSPFMGKTLRGFPVMTIHNGKIVWRDAEIYP